MLEKLDIIKKVGLFNDYVHAPECLLGEVTLVYGENGVGKSTIAAILDSLRESNGDEIVRRTSLPGTIPPSVVLTLDGKAYTFDGTCWDSQPPYNTLDVFFPGFVSRNVHAASAIETEHKRNLCELVLGREAVTKAEQLAQADDKAREALKQIKSIEGEIKLLIKSPETLETFLGMPADPQITEKLDVARAELAQAKGMEAILVRPVPQPQELLVVNRNTITSLLERNSSLVGADVVRSVRQHISDRLDPSGEAWLAYGTKHVKDGACPFCAQDLEDSGVAEAIRQYFSAEYQDYTNAISEDIAALRIGLGLTAFQQLRARILEQIAIAIQWASDVEIDQAQLTGMLDTGETSWEQGVAKLDQLLDEKLAQPLIRLDPTTASEAIAALELALAQLRKVNAILDECRSKAEAKKKVLTETEIAQVEAKVKRLEDQKVRFEPLAEKLIARRNALLIKRKDLEEEKKGLKQEIDERADRVVGKYQEAINHYLEYFGCDTRIESFEPKFPSGKASVQYKLLAHGYEILLGFSDTAPCFDTVLSEGDKYTLALSFFFARLKHHIDLSGRVIVLDDPVNSLGSSRRGLIESVIRDLRNRGAQVVVLTHDERLAAMIWSDRGLKLKDIAMLQVQRSNSGSHISSWDVERALQSKYVQSYLTLNAFLESGGDHHSAARCIRPYLEQRLRHIYPGPPFHTRDSLGAMIGMIRDSQPGSRLYELQNKLEQLEAINAAALPSHHATDDVPGMEPLSPEEVRLYTEKALAVLG